MVFPAVDHVESLFVEALRNTKSADTTLWVFSSAGRAPRLHRGCHRFDPGRTHQRKPRFPSRKRGFRHLRLIVPGFPFNVRPTPYGFLPWSTYISARPPTVSLPSSSGEGGSGRLPSNLSVGSKGFLGGKSKSACPGEPDAWILRSCRSRCAWGPTFGRPWPPGNSFVTVQGEAGALGARELWLPSATPLAASGNGRALHRDYWGMPRWRARK